MLIYFWTLILCFANSQYFYEYSCSQLSRCLWGGSALCPNRWVAVSVLITFCFTAATPPSPHPHTLSTLRAMCVILAGSEKLRANICLPVWQRSTVEGDESCSVHQRELCSEWGGDTVSAFVYLTPPTMWLKWQMRIFANSLGKKEKMRGC